MFLLPRSFLKYALGVWKFKISFMILCVKMTEIFCFATFWLYQFSNVMSTANEDTSNLISLILGIIFCFT